MNEHWLPSEKRLLAQLEIDIVKEGNSVLLLAPRVTKVQDAIASLINKFWDSHLSKTTFFDSEHIGSPAETLQKVCYMDKPLLSPSALDDINKDYPFIVFFNNVRPAEDKSLEQLLLEWSNYIKEGHMELEAGRGLRVLFCVNQECLDWVNLTGIPDPFKMVFWPTPSLQELGDYAVEKLYKYFPEDEAYVQFLKGQCLDMAGCIRQNVDEAINLVLSNNKNNDFFSKDSVLKWPDNHYLVIQARDWPRTELQKKATSELIYRGGILPLELKREFVQRLGPVLEELWLEGFWYETGYFGALTPAACSAWHPGFLFPHDNSAAAMLNSCLVVERQLKHRLYILYGKNERVRRSVKEFLDAVYTYKGQSCREYIELQLGKNFTQDIDYICNGSLSTFLACFCYVLGLIQKRGLFNHMKNELNDNIRDFIDLRNYLAHGGRATWEHFGAMNRILPEINDLGLELRAGQVRLSLAN